MLYTYIAQLFFSSIDYLKIMLVGFGSVAGVAAIIRNIVWKRSCRRCCYPSILAGVLGVAIVDVQGDGRAEAIGVAVFPLLLGTLALVIAWLSGKVYPIGKEDSGKSIGKDDCGRHENP